MVRIINGEIVQGKWEPVLMLACPVSGTFNSTLLDYCALQMTTQS